MNKKISKIRDDIINSIEKGSQGANEKISQKMLIKEKEEQIANREKIMENINEQIKMENIQLKGFQLVK